MKIGMVGLGRMGANMAARLLQAGHQVVAFDRHAEKVRAVAGEGADSGHADRPFRAMPITCSGQGDRPGRDAAG